MKNLKFLNLIILLSLPTACGYRWKPDSLAEGRPTLTVPYVVGDEDGFLTAEIIQALSRSGLVQVLSAKGEYRLEVSITGSATQTVGYRIDPQKVDGEIKKDLLATEGRRSLSLEARLYRGSELIFGPYQVSADADYDYVDGDSIQDLTFTNPAGTLVTVLPFSLGQLEPNESAQEAAAAPLYARLAQKIVDVLSAEW